MSDFDVVLERLLTDPSFPARLAADPAGALAGYALTTDEADLLRQQVSSDAGAPAAVVEDRVTKSSTFGLLAAFDTGGGGVARDGFGSAPVAGLGAPGRAEWSDLGTAAGAAARAAAEGAGAGSAIRSGFGAAPGLEGGSGVDGSAAAASSSVAGFGDAPRSGLGEREQFDPPKGYHNRVDADGDGRLDPATYRGRAGGGAEIRVDLDGDGRADFVGVDEDLDHRVDFADYDKDHDGVLDQRMVDDDGDGFLDRTIRR
jgi:hypothetical protein